MLHYCLSQTAGGSIRLAVSIYRVLYRLSFPLADKSSVAVTVALLNWGQRSTVFDTIAILRLRYRLTLLKLRYVAVIRVVKLCNRSRAIR